MDMLEKYEDEKCVALKQHIAEWKKQNSSHSNLKAVIAQKIRIYSQQVMIQALIDSFNKYHDDILSGEFDLELLENSDARSLKNLFKEIAKCCFDDSVVLKRELLGNTVLSYLLKEFYQCTDGLDVDNIPNTKNGRLYRIISSQFRHLYEQQTQSNPNVYSRIQLAADFTSGMTVSWTLFFGQVEAVFKLVFRLHSQAVGEVVVSDIIKMSRLQAP